MKRIFRVSLSITLLCLSLAGLIFFLWPTYQKLRMLHTQVKVQRERLESGQKALEQLRKIEEAVLAHEEDFAKIDNAIPEDAGLPGVYDHIQELGAVSGLVMQSIEGEIREEPDAQVTVLAFKVEFVGSYEGLKNFLEAAKSSARIFNVNTISISSVSDASDELNIEIEIFAYAVP